ncbi:MAG: hypothetical protein IPH63_16870 [Flavobacteriales bacterium]|nr:hypothetical protein [Flavobacteriales bacterium]
MSTRNYARTLFVPALLACTISPVRAQHPRPQVLRGGTVSGNTYCHPSFFNDGGAPDFIDGVVLGGISTANTGFTSDVNGWNDRFFDGLGTVTALQKGGSFVLAITTGTAPNSHYYAWLDLNRDGTFANNELLGHLQERIRCAGHHFLHRPELGTNRLYGTTHPVYHRKLACP